MRWRVASLLFFLCYPNAGEAQYFAEPCRDTNFVAETRSYLSIIEATQKQLVLHFRYENISSITSFRILSFHTTPNLNAKLVYKNPTPQCLYLVNYFMALLNRITITAAARSSNIRSKMPESFFVPANNFDLFGVSLAGAEFTPRVLPGVLNTDYIYPNNSDVKYFRSKGLNIIRLPFLWERLQPVQNGPLNPAELTLIDDVVSYASLKGMKVELEPHGYGYGYGYLIGSAATPDASFANFWKQLSSHYAANSNVLFGLMNEPHRQSARQWANSAQTAINAIRQTGATSQEILVPGTAWSSGQSWLTSGNAIALASTIKDPSHNMAFAIHQYLDPDSSGKSTTTVSPTIGAERLREVTYWAEANKFRLFLAEFGAGSDQASLTALSNMLDYMQDHTDVWQGGAIWAGGSWWHEYPFSVEPFNGIDKPQMEVLDRHAPATRR